MKNYVKSSKKNRIVIEASIAYNNFDANFQSIGELLKLNWETAYQCSMQKLLVESINKAVIFCVCSKAISKTEIQSIFSSFTWDREKTVHISILWGNFFFIFSFSIWNYNRWAQTFRSFLCDWSRFRTYERHQNAFDVEEQCF